VLFLQLIVKFLPLLIEVLSIFLILLDCKLLLLGWVHLEGFFVGKRVDLLQDSLEGDEGLLQDLVPMVLCKVHDDWHQHWESLLFIGLQNVQEIIILEEAHGSIGNLEMDTADASDDSLEKSWDKVLNFVDLTDLEDLLEFSQEKSFLDAISEWPILEETFQKRNSQSSIFGEEKH